jgi:transposase
LVNRRGAALVTACAALTADEARLNDPLQATRAALGAVATRVQALNAEITQADKHLRPIVAKAAPRLSSLYRVGPETAGQLLTTAGDNPNRLRSEAALAHLCGAAPLPASSGRTDRHRLNRSGFRDPPDRRAGCRVRGDRPRGGAVPGADP